MLGGGTGERCFGAVGLSVRVKLGCYKHSSTRAALTKGHACSGLTEAHSSGLLEAVPLV